MLGNSFNVQEGKYALEVYSKEAIKDVAVEKRVKVTSKLIKFFSILETNGTPKVEVLGDGELPNPVNITNSSVLNSTKQNILAAASGAEYVSGDLDWASNKTVNPTFKIGGDSITISFNKNYFNQEKANILKAAKAGDKFNFTKISTTVHNDTAQLLFSTNSIIEDATPPVEPTAVKIDALPSNEVFVGGQLTLSAKVTPAEASQDVEWSIESGKDFADLDGATLVGKAAGTVVVKVIAKGHENISDAVTITVKETEKTLIESIVASPSSKEIRIGDDPFEIGITVTPAQNDETVVWSIKSGSDYITLDEVTHKVSPVAVGKATVLIEGSISHKGCEVEVTVKAESALADAYLGALDSKTDTFTFEGVVVSKNKNAHVVQQGEYGINVYKAAPDGVNVGDTVEVTSTMTLYQGCPQTDSVSSETKLEKVTPLPQAASVTSKASLDALKHSVLANVAEATFVEKQQDKTWASDKTAQYTYTIGSDSVTVSFDKQAYSDEMATIANAATPGDKYVFSNVITAAYSGVNQLNFAGTSSIEKIEKEVEAISIKDGHGPSKTSYFDGDQFDATGLVLNVSYKGESGTTEVTYNSTTAAKFTFDKPVLHTGDSEIIVTFGGKTAKITGISVSAIELSYIELDITDVTREFVKDSPFSYEGLVVTAQYNNGKSKIVIPTSVSTPDMSTAGEKTVTVSYTEGTITETDTYTITVQASKVDVEGVSLDTTSLEIEVGKTHQFVATITPSNATDKSVTWNLVTPSVENCAKITSNGLFTAEKAGTVTVRVTTTDGGKTADCTVTIKEAQKVESVYYTLTPASGTNNSYASNCDIVIAAGSGDAATSSITWNLTGNSTMNPWRMGGGKTSGLDGVDRALYSKTAMGSAVTKVEMEIGNASNITINSVHLIVSANADFTSIIEDVNVGTSIANKTTTISASSGSWASGAYYKFVFNVTVASGQSSHRFIEFASAKFYYLH